MVQVVPAVGQPWCQFGAGWLAIGCHKGAQPLWCDWIWALTVSTSEIFNAEVLFREDCSPDEFIDVIVGNRVYMPCLYVSILGSLASVTSSISFLYQRKSWNFTESWNGGKGP